MATFVLVPGAWHGGWCYRHVTRGLRAGGHDVYPLTLTGLGDRLHLAAREVNLDTHVQDVVAAVTSEEIEDAVLVGHSYGGMVITGVAEQLADRFRTIVYLDAFVPESGHSLASSAPPERHEQRVRTAREQGDGWRIPCPEPGFWGIDDTDVAAWLKRRLCDHPLATFEQVLIHTNPWERIGKRIFIVASENEGAPFIGIAERLRNDPSWEVHEFGCGHEIMIDMPGELVDLLVTLAD